MDTVNEDFVQPDVDAVMTMLTPADVPGQDIDASDEVERLRNSLRESVHDESVRPKMQCLMMDSSFSMVTMQGEDSGIAWETTPSRSNTPRASEPGMVEVSSPVAVRPATPGSHPAGKIIFLMDEEMISRRRKPKERASSQKSKAEKNWDILEGSSENISGRPELVEVSQPNVKTEEGYQEEANDSMEDKEQRLFSIVSEGLEILNIVVPPKMATVDEEESKEMTDNLSYLEESLVPKASEDTQDAELPILAESEAGVVDQPAPPTVVGVMDPPGAPVARPLPKGAAGNVDYFEAFSMIDAQAPGSPAVIKQEQEEAEIKAVTEGQDSEKPEESKGNTFTANVDGSDTNGLEEITSELLDVVFYAGTESFPEKSLDTGDGVAEGATSRLPSKPSGSNLFGSQEEILTPIFLPEGPPKIIDPILLEEPKAMAFLYTDLYEKALGTWKKDEDAESMTSEKSFHSRHSDREARGYLEKYVLIDETPAVEVEPEDKEKGPEGEARVLAQDLYDFPDFQTTSEKGEAQYAEEVTDFLRSSANSSPYEMEPFLPSLEEYDNQTSTKPKAKTEKRVSIAVETVPETPVDPLSISSFEFPPDELEWGGSDDYPPDLDEQHVSARPYPESQKQYPETNKPVAPPRRKAASSPKACLDLTPLTPADGVTQENEEAGVKEQREEEKETASPAETTDEGDGDGEETPQASSDVALLENVLAALEPESAGDETVKDSNKINDSDAKQEEEKDTKPEEEEAKRETETASNETDVKEADVKMETNPETQGGTGTSTALSDEPAKKGQCIIL
ncbi:cardiomyopathy-associated protein 5 [Cololabis saira]|uniref:cardiomyopathy-associated protein 5 n=1 Tax=Cololabis saira TaxID=129043 RepID=UPI002AD557B5|nr:cardiomyopathy-associated protein 5 [Cololabis saira]